MNKKELADIRILVTEDEESMLSALADKIRYTGFAEALTARNGEEGLKIALQEHPDLLLVDILMPKMDGITMIKRIREDAWGKSAKIILLTNFDTTDEMLKDVALIEPSYYLLKSNWSIDDVMTKIKEVLELL
ncbi:hypothetical protein A2524_00380 [Candidatus Wolfebacteria bacterium RIFOXYD12_FULL_48_21]|uniref:Response regulatory domain-containing protein n=1 Tax=Candidatus Wolfebacteria bacterium RIFOXYD1_FULL_48_65 TaxID=1802561 RepID=A0A1F8E1N6_9BACT|nr:MAG: hypothetical protein A2610_01455 [Candidatus Wolfebacteria bacterium RIFOXYD1_FULL_48_65]OGM94898.1 MAG: hypothetical protein A2524_00380 [Candidatus Wolfebacteria bacterium RIFOXYD12_FULL_48_21]OGM96522.1 MAG: hypothetical protein A2532_02235 [Candidatus Wolfebacteria bacterium RIFOXYD2_FULL_48_11]